jgi:hypothetical protein
MRMLTKYQLSCNGYMVSELGSTRISLVVEHNVYHLKSTNILGAGQVWEVIGKYKDAIKKFKALRVIQRGKYELIQYEVNYAK